MKNSGVVSAAGSKRDEIIALAYKVFNRHGFYETGVDRLFADSGISKRTVYKYFRSKEELIAAAIHYYQQKTLAGIQAELEQRCKNAKEKLLTLFDMKYQELSADNYNGCFAINAWLVYGGNQAEIREAYASFLENVQNFITHLCGETGCQKPEITGKKIMLLFMGTIVHGQSKHDPEAAHLARETVRSLIA